VFCEFHDGHKRFNGVSGTRGSAFLQGSGVAITIETLGFLGEAADQK
jgi:hypothetical protein